MGKKKISILGSENEDTLRAKKARQLEQKKLREGKKAARAPGLKGGQRVVDTTEESLRELEVIQAKQQVTAPQTPAKPSRTHIRSKSYTAAKSRVDPAKTYSIPDALQLLRQVSYSKFDPTVELHLTLQEKTSPTEIELPHSTGKIRRVAIADEATVAKIAAGKIDFDVLLASPAQMPSLVKYAKVLGPRGLMPNPKTGSVVPDPAATAKSLSAKNTLTLRCEPDTPVIHLAVGKLSMTDSILSANITSVLSALSVPLKKAVLKSTHSPAIKLAS